MTKPIKDMRIAQVMAGGERGGAENFFVRLTAALHETPGLKQRAFIRPQTERIEALHSSGLSTETFRLGGPLDVLGHYRYRKALLRFEPHIVMTWMNRATGLTPPGPYQLVARLGSYYNLKYYRHCDHWIGISKGLCDHLINGGMPAEKVTMIPNFANETPVIGVARTAFDTPAEAPILLAAGRFHETKGFDVLICALRRVPGAILWLAGAGPEEENLRDLAKSQRVSERVRFVGWCENVATLMQTADLFICPSRHEGLGSVVMEAWFNGCPIVATNSQGPGEVIEHGQTGLLTPVDDVDALTDAISSALENPEQRRTLAANARAHYAQKYSREVVLAQYRELFTTLRR